jgi:hypothetical protein
MNAETVSVNAIPRTERVSGMRTVLPAVLVLIALSAVGVSISVLSRSSGREISQRQVESGFAAAGVSLSQPRSPLSKPFPVTYYSQTLNAYVLVWPSASARKSVASSNAPAGPSVLKLTRANVEIDLPAHAVRAIAKAKTVLGTLGSD